MHEYMMEVFHRFRGDETFTVKARSKAEAVIEGRRHLVEDTNDMFELQTVRCLKKLKPKKEK